MEPYIHDGDSVVLKQSDTPVRGEIIFFKPPETWTNDREILFVKRIVATPGDVFSFDGKRFTINGESEYDLPDDMDCSRAPQHYSKTLKRNEVVAFGDNASNSIDSRWAFCQGKINDFTVTKKASVDYGKIIMKW